MVLNGLLMITGGCYKGQFGLRSNVTEIVNLSTGETGFAGNLNVPRSGFGLSLIKMGSKLRLIAFGGTTFGQENYLDSIEMFDEASQTWKVTTMRLQQKRRDFGYLGFSSRFEFNLAN